LRDAIPYSSFRHKKEPEISLTQVLRCLANGTLEEATLKLLAAAKEKWGEYDEWYCDPCPEDFIHQIRWI
jgi:hypothetical protein